jgi:hypothetical protein
MTEVFVTTQLPEYATLWRYVSLDKLVDLLSTSELFFTPIAYFAQEDPFEGYLPAVCLRANASVFKPFIGDLENVVDQLAALWQCEPGKLEYLRIIRERAASLKTLPTEYFQAVTRCITVNCWHANNCESEAMWRLYAENGKACAIETNVSALKDAVQSAHSNHRVHIFPVKYLDFFDETLRPADCIVEGRLVPFLKRQSYQHENEVRASIHRVPEDVRQAANLAYWQPQPVRLPISTRALIKRIHVSPYAKEPFFSGVKRICEAFGVQGDLVVSSRLLSGREELIKALAI